MNGPKHVTIGKRSVAADAVKKKSLLARFADLIDAPAAEKKLKDKSAFARRWRHPFKNNDYTSFVSRDLTQYDWRPNGSLHRRRLWLKGHDGKVQRKQYRKLRFNGLSREAALAAVGIR